MQANDRKVMLRTLNCTSCTNLRAEFWGAHLHHETAGVIAAGWCKQCRPGRAGRDERNCLGAWFPQLGLMIQTGKTQRSRIIILREDGDQHHGLHVLQ